MAPEWIYLMKVNIGITLFYAFYKLFCQRDTFFWWRRFSLLSFLGISFLYPLLNIQGWLKEQPAIYELTNYYTTLMADELVVTAPATHTPTSVLPSLTTISTCIYFAGVIILSLRFIIQLFSICRMRHLGTPVYIKEQCIISLPSGSNSFSFFGWIFIPLSKLEEESFNEVLMHEQTHVREWHSIDVLLSEIINIICWFNPFSWLLKAEVRLNLEYLADDKVTQTMDNRKQYQYHLLGLAYTGQQSGLYNNFNVSHIKNRIIMMNKKRTRMAGRIKYALFAPLAAALLLVSNISCISTEKKNEQAETPVQVSTAPVTNPEAAPASTGTSAPSTDTSEVFKIVEVQPQFPGGMEACMKWIADNVKYPAISAENGVQGRVTVRFIIEKDGSITNAEVVRGVDPNLDKEALRVISKMPKWEAGKQRGKAVRCYFNLPVKFRLN